MGLMIVSLLPCTRPLIQLRPADPATNVAAGACLAPARPWRRQRAWLSPPVSAVAPSAGKEVEEKEEGRFDWLDQWYPLSAVCDLDPGAPHGKTVLGLRVVAWYDRAAGEWRVFDDACPYRLAPLSEGRIDDKGRLQCVYHGWCFDGSGSCRFIPQAPALGPPVRRPEPDPLPFFLLRSSRPDHEPNQNRNVWQVHKNSKACVAAYPAVVQNNILWFYPRTGAEHQDVLRRKRPPFIPEIEDPSFVTSYDIRDLSCG